MIITLFLGVGVAVLLKRESEEGLVAHVVLDGDTYQLFLDDRYVDEFLLVAQFDGDIYGLIRTVLDYDRRDQGQDFLLVFDVHLIIFIYNQAWKNNASSIRKH